MIHTVIKQHSIIPLNRGFNEIKGSSANAFAQLEIYHTDKSPVHNIGVINTYSNTFTYNIGSKIDVVNRITVTPSIWLENAVMTPFLQKYIQDQKHMSL